MRALTWQGIADVGIEEVPDPTIVNPRDAILRVTATTICGSDLHLYDGFIPAMQRGDILGHEFMGVIEEVGPGVTEIQPGDRVVVPPFIACGTCFSCNHGLYSLCDNTNPNAALGETLWGQAVCGTFGYSHVTGGYPGSMAQYVRVPMADFGPRRVPEGLSDDQALWTSDALATGYFGADLCDLEAGDTVAVWGCGAVGLFAVASAYLLGAERVVAIDRLPERLELARAYGAEPLDYTTCDVVEELKQMTAGRGPDACIDAVGMEAHKPGAYGAYDRLKQAMRLESDRPFVLREAIQACRKGGTIAILGVYGGLADKVPMGAAMNKSLTFRMGQQHTHRYLEGLLEHVAAGRIDTTKVITHKLPLDEAPRGFDMFKKKHDGCVRVLLTP